MHRQWWTEVVSEWRYACAQMSDVGLLIFRRFRGRRAGGAWRRAPRRQAPPARVRKRRRLFPSKSSVEDIVDAAYELIREASLQCVPFHSLTMPQSFSLSTEYIDLLHL